MSKYKLVPIEPTREMWAAAGDAVVALNSQHHDAISEAVYKAMLASAPAVEQAPVAWVSPNALSRLSPDSPVNCALVHKIRINESFPLYLHPQPTPEVTKLVEPTAWLVREKTFCGDVTTNKDAAEFCEQLSPNSTTPLYTHPQPTPEVAKLVESLEVAHRFIANGIELGYIQMPDSDTLDPAHETLPAIEAALAEYRAQGGDV